MKFGLSEKSLATPDIYNKLWQRQSRAAMSNIIFLFATIVANEYGYLPHVLLLIYKSIPTVLAMV